MSHGVFANGSKPLTARKNSCKIHTVYQEKIMDTSFVWLYEALGTMALASLIMAIVVTVIQYLEQETPWKM